MNPNTNIFVLFLSPSKYTRLRNWSQFQGILNYKNVQLKFFNTEDFTKDTIVEDWIRKGLLTSSWYQVAHTSDILRYALLYKYSGIYLDLDVIVRKSLDEIELENFACFQDDREIINNAIMKIGDDDGRQLGKMLLK
jgi:lactosylceramide 4-alpha-galactosyltransferase